MAAPARCTSCCAAEGHRDRAETRTCVRRRRPPRRPLASCPCGDPPVPARPGAHVGLDAPRGVRLGSAMARQLIDLHIHVGGAVAPHVLWSIAHQQGFKLPVKGYFEFVELITSHPDKVGSLEEYLKILHTWTEKIQSSPSAIERSVYEVIGKEYRGSRVSTIELRFNPMKRNLNSELDLDHIIHAALRGM